MAKKQAFVTLKDHKNNFENSLPCRLINPAKSETGLISKVILDKISNAVRTATGVNQWKNSMAVIDWFKNLQEKNKHTFISFDIVDFYPSISESLLMKAIDFAKMHTHISSKEIKIIMHSRKSLLFDKGKPWMKKESKDLFDVTMGSYDGAEICDLVGLFILNTLSQEHGNEGIGLYRDDGLAAFKNISGSRADRIRKNITKTFQELGLKITIDCNLKITNFLDITLNLNNGQYYPYRKPNDRPVYIHKQSNHPPTIIKNLPASISRRISDISCDEETFKKASPVYEDALKASGYTESLIFTENEAKKKNRNRQRNIIWFNPPFSRNVATNIGGIFLKLLDKHFPKKSKLNKIFNRNTVKISYSCMPNVASVIKAHNKQISTDNAKMDQKICNCRKKDLCPFKETARLRVSSTMPKSKDRKAQSATLASPSHRSKRGSTTTCSLSGTRNTKAALSSPSTSGSWKGATPRSTSSGRSQKDPRHTATKRNDVTSAWRKSSPSSTRTRPHY